MTINVNVSVSIAPQTQQFLREIVKVYTPSDLAEIADVKSRIDVAHDRLALMQKRLDQVDSHLQQKASV